MQTNLVIVESPAKAKTLEKFLGEDYKVLSSYGHIRDLKKNEFSVDLNNFTPQYEIPEEKVSLVKSLKTAASKADTVWLASDEDREGEAISWHLAQVLGLNVEQTKRIVFHEITKTAILEAIKHPRHIDINLVNAQQARRVLDRIVGFKLSPVLWRKVKPALSAGRVQSVAVRLIVEREREVENFKSESSYKVTAVFVSDKTELKAEFSQRFATQEEARAFLKSCQGQQFVISDISKKPMQRVPAPPFTTSTLQQEAARKLGFSVAQTMSVAQRLYEAGIITYMRTDSVNLSTLCLNACKKEIEGTLGAKYAKRRQYQTRSKGAQEAHEAIRPTYMDQHEIQGTAPERKLYELIWKRTIASQMADAELEKTIITILPVGSKEASDANFVASAEMVTFDGFLRVYRESFDDENMEENETTTIDEKLKENQLLDYKEIQATERFSQCPLRYTEASLVKKLEELGIGRPSTYAPTISTIQQREYVQKGDKKGEKRAYKLLTLKAGKDIKESEKSEIVGNEKGKLLPTDTGTVVNDFLVANFENIVNYNFTANVEKDFDEIAEGKENWQQAMEEFYKKFEPQCEKVLHERNEHKAGERVLGIDPKSGKEVSVKIGRFGPVVQIGSATDEEKPRFAQLSQGQSLQTITLEEALELFKLPRELGSYEGASVSIGTGRFGPYVLHNKQYVSIPNDIDPMTMELSDAIKLIEERKKAEAAKHLKSFEEDAEMQILNGRYGPYIVYNGSNYRLPKTIKEPTELSYEQCLEIVEKESAKPKMAKKKKK
ncbi:MAG: type I DNA topoisomerase [Bacteroidaceae bacterium]|nr:type I DNA topoisomerase [Bacteroidaceae bacterium]MBR3530822.1 type I DNA topoisomerase [Bacteroidaceae bacterium]